MSNRLKSDVSMQERLKDFDPDGSLRERAREIYALFENDSTSQSNSSFWEAFLDRSGLKHITPSEEIESAIRGGAEYVRKKYTDFGSEGWADMARQYARLAQNKGVSLRTVLACLSIAHETTIQRIYTCIQDDPARASRLATALLQIAVVESEVMCSALSDDRAQQEQQARQHNSALFQ